MSNSALSQDERLRRPAGIRSLRLGETTVTYVPDGSVQLRPRGWLPGTTDEVWAAHPQYLDDSGNLVGSIGGLLVEHGERALLIDAGFGPQSFEAQPGNWVGAVHGGALLDNLAAVGRRPEEIDTLAFTHLHGDHFGWAWQPAPGSDQLAFTKADYLISAPEWAHGGDTTEQIRTALAPRVRTVSDNEEIFPGVRVRVTAGHTAGHAVYVITSAGKRLIAFGDALHSPIQVDHPEWSAASDHDPVQSAELRRQLVDELGQPDTIGFGGHFADVVFGQVRRDGNGPAWRPIDA